MKKATILVVLLFTGLLAACMPAGAVDTTLPTDSVQPLQPVPTLEEMISESSVTEAGVGLPAWFHETLQNVSTGEAFTIADHSGKVVIVELMAMWCSTCLAQQTALQGTLSRLGDPADVVVIVVDVDANERAEDLNGYAQQHGFPWIYAVATTNLAREIGNTYGALYLQPPAAPMLVIDRSGTVHPLVVGYKNEVQLTNILNPFLVQP